MARLFAFCSRLYTNRHTYAKNFFELTKEVKIVKRTRWRVMVIIGLTLAGAETYLASMDKTWLIGSNIEEKLDETLRLWLAVRDTQNNDVPLEMVNQRLSVIFSDPFSMDVVKEKGVAYFVNILKAQDMFMPELLLQLQRLSKYKHWCDEIGEHTNLLSFLIRNVDKLPDPKGSTKYFTLLVTNLVKNEKNVKKLLEELDIQALLNSLDGLRKKNYATLASVLFCYLHNTPIFRAELAKVSPYYTSTLKYNVQQLVNQEPSAIWNQLLIEDALIVTKGWDGGIESHVEDFDRTKVYILQKYYAAIYIYSCWLISIWWKKPANVSFKRAAIPAVLYGTFSYCGFYLTYFPIKQYLKNEKHTIMDPSYDARTETKRYMIKGLKCAQILEQLFFAYYCKFSFFPTLVRFKLGPISAELHLPISQ